MTSSKAARLSALLIGASMVFTATSSFAQTRRTETSAERRAAAQAREQQQQQQQGQAAQPGQPPQRRFELSRPEQQALVPLEQAVQAAQTAGAGANWSAAQALVPAAQAAARGNDARYLLAKFQYSIAVGTTNLEGQEAALTAIVGNASTPAEERAQAQRIVARIPHTRAERAFAANDFAGAERIYRQILQANPGDELAQNNLRVTLGRLGNTAGSLELLQQQIRAAEANGGKAPEALYRQAWDAARRGTNAAATAGALRNLVVAYPTPANWRLALEGARSRAGEDTQFLVDIYRFGRIANVIQTNEYVPLVNTFGQAALLAETRATLQAGIAANAIQATQVLNPNNAPGGGRAASQLLTDYDARMRAEQTGLAGELTQARAAANGRQASNIGDALYGYGRYAEAADAYRLALSKGGVDSNLINTRIGASLAQAGDRAGAETALRAVTGPRAELAAIWLTWLASRPA